MKTTSKRSTLMLALLILFTCMEIVSVQGSKQVLVGGHKGWHVPYSNDTDIYNDWASKKRLHVGDSLRFEYQNDSVVVVDKYGYYHCDTSKAKSFFKDGNTVIELNHSGPAYFISGISDHCKSGQRLVVNVMSPHDQHHSPSPDSTPPVTLSPEPTPSSGVTAAALGPLAVVVAFSMILFI